MKYSPNFLNMFDSECSSFLVKYTFTFCGISNIFIAFNIFKSESSIFLVSKTFVLTLVSYLCVVGKF